MKKTVLAAALLAVAGVANAAPVPFDNNGAANFTMYDGTGAVVGNLNDITGFVDLDAMTFGVASASLFFGAPWTASGGTLFSAGTYTVDVNGDGANAPAGSELVTFTVGAGQMGGNINFAWTATTGIDVFIVWDLVPTGTPGSFSWVSSDIDGDDTPGLGMVDGPFPGFSANFNFEAPAPSAVPVPAAAWLLGSGLMGLVGVARRRKAA